MKLNKIFDKRVMKAVFMSLMITALFGLGFISMLLDYTFWAHFDIIIAGLSVYGLALEYFGIKKNKKEENE